MIPFLDSHRGSDHHAGSLANHFALPPANLVRVGSRRWFLQTGLAGLAGLSMLALLSARAQAFVLTCVVSGHALLQAEQTSAPRTPTAIAPAALDPINEMAAKLKPTRTIVYKTVGDRQLHLHVFEPTGHKLTDRRACFLAIHGGGWTGGEPRRFYPFADHFAKLGLVGISLEYRLMSSKLETTPFDCVIDGRSAVRYIRAHAAELGVDPNKIVVSGGSAGGHVAAGTALFDGIDDENDDKLVSPVPAAAVLLFPVIDTSPEGYGNAKCGERWQEISPLHRVKAGAPPTIIFHGTGDTVTPFAGAQAFHTAMQKAGNRCELIVNRGGRHGYLMFDRSLYDETIQKSEDFLRSLSLLGNSSTASGQ